MKRGKRSARLPSPGDVLEILLPDGSLGYARLLNAPLMGFFAFRRMSKNDEPIDFSAVHYAFKIWVHDSCLRGGRWRVYCQGELSRADLVTPQFVHQDFLSKRVRKYQDGHVVPGRVSMADAATLEPSAVWEAEQAEESLLDYFEGRENKHLRNMRARIFKSIEP